MADRIQQRRDTAARWTQFNPILLEGEVGYELDTDQYKVGDGVNAWNSLPYRGDPCVDQIGSSQTTPMSQAATTRELMINRGNGANGAMWRKQTGSLARTEGGDGWTNLSAEQIEAYARVITRAELIGDALPDKDYYIWIMVGPNNTDYPRRITIAYDNDSGTAVNVFDSRQNTPDPHTPFIMGSTTGAKILLWLNWDAVKDLPANVMINGNVGGKKLVFNKPFISYATDADSPYYQEQQILKDIAHDAIITNRLYLKNTTGLDNLTDDEKTIIGVIRSIRLVNNLNRADVSQRGAFISRIIQSKTNNNWEIRINYADNANYVLIQTLTEQPKDGMTYYPAGQSTTADSAGVIVDMDWSKLPDEFSYNGQRLSLSFDGNNIFDVSSVLGDSPYIPNSQLFNKVFVEKGLIPIKNITSASAINAINAINALFVANAKSGVEYRLTILCGYVVAYPFRIAISTSEGKIYTKDWYGYTADNIPPNKFIFQNTSQDGGNEIFCVDIDWSSVPTGIVLNNTYNAALLKLSTTYVNSYFVQNFIEEGIANLASKQEVQKFYSSINDLPDSSYGGTNITAWGFPIGARRKISQISFPFSFGTNNKIRIIFKKKDYSGEVVYDEIHDASNLITLDEVVNDTDNNAELWLELYPNTIGFSVRRTGASAIIYTAGKGYPSVRFSTNIGFDNPTLSSIAGYMDIHVDLFCVDTLYQIKPEVLPTDENSPYATKSQLDAEISQFSQKLLAQGGTSVESTNYATGYAVKNKYAYMPGHDANTDIKNGVHSDFFNKDVSAVLTFKQTNSFINGTFARNIIQKLAELEAQGYFVPSFVCRADRYNSGDVAVMSTLALRMRYTKDGVTTYYLPTTGYVNIPAKSMIHQELTVTCPSSWADVASKNMFDDYSSFQSNFDTPECWVEIANFELRYVDPTGQDVDYPTMVDPKVIGTGIKEEQLDEALQKKIEKGGSGENAAQILKNLRICCAGSSVTWGTGYLRDSMLLYLISDLQKTRTDFVGINAATVTGNKIYLQSTNDKLFFDGEAMKVTGIGATIEFQSTGDEVSIVHAIERSNASASDIEVYFDGVLTDTFSNFNDQPLGHTTKTFTAVQGQKEFPLLMPFTYNHVIKVNGIEQQVTLNKGTAMPSSGWAVARDIQMVNGQAEVQHTLFSPTALNEGDTVTCEFDYGQEIVYSHTTIGKDGNGVLESTYGRGYTPFDPANPGSAAFGSGLDFRYTDERIIRKYTFADKKTRDVKIRIKGLNYRATDQMSDPYFIFNFATNRILYFMNAGIVGWKISQFLDATNSNGNILRTWREIVDWQPDIIFYESTPNDDWGVGGYKLYTEMTGLTLAQLQNIRTMPNKQILFVSNDNYTYQRWEGKIEELTKDYVIFTSDTKINAAPSVGDSVVIGTYFSDNWQQVVRLVRSYDADTRKITFDRPINKRDFVYEDFSDFVGMEIQVRDLAAYDTPTQELLDKFKDYGNRPLVGLVPNPAPNMLSRDLSSYQALLNKIANDKELADWYVGMPNVLDWQHSQVLNQSVTVNASDLVTQSDGTKRLDLTGMSKGNNWMDFHIFIGDKEVTNRDAVVYTSYCLGVDRTLTGAALNDTTTRGKQVWGNFYPTLVFLKNAPTSGQITVKATSVIWSGDSCHVNTYSQKLFALAYAKFVE